MFVIDFKSILLNHPTNVKHNLGMENYVITDRERERENCKAQTLRYYNGMLFGIQRLWKRNYCGLLPHSVRDKFSHVFIIPSASSTKSSSAKLSFFVQLFIISTKQKLLNIGTFGLYQKDTKV